MTLWQRIKAVFRPPSTEMTFTGQDIEDLAGYLVAPTLSYQITDGVDYSQPPILPQWLAKDMTFREQHAYLAEASKAFRFQFDTPYEGDEPIAPVADDPLYEWPSDTRVRILTNCHAAYQRNPQAKAGVDYSNGFIIGDGFNLTCKNEAVETFLNDFIANPDNDIRAYEKCVTKDLQVDGEIMLRRYSKDGMVVFAPLRPWECTEIKTEAGFFRRKLAYCFQRQVASSDVNVGGITEEEEIPAAEILHVAINRHGYELRGKPDLFVVLPWLRAYNDWLQNRARINHYLNAFLWHLKVDTQKPGTVAAVGSRFKEPPAPGSVYTSSNKQELVAVNGNVRSNDASEDGRQIRMMTNTGLRMPEYMLGDGENANLATATAQQIPALTKFQDYQQILREQLWKPMFKQALQAAVDAGQLPEYVEEQDSNGETVYEEPDTDTLRQQPPPRPERPTTGNGQAAEADDTPPELPVPVAQPVRQGPAVMVKTVDAFDVTYEPISKDDPQTLAQALQIFFQNDAISLQTMQEEGGFDPAVEEKRKIKEQQQKLTDMAQGLRPIPPGMMGTPTVAEQMGQGGQRAN